MRRTLSKPALLADRNATPGTPSPESNDTIIDENKWAEDLIKAVDDGLDSEVQLLLKKRDKVIIKSITKQGTDQQDDEKRTRGNRVTQKQADLRKASESQFGSDALIRALFKAIDSNKSSIAAELIRARGPQLYSPNPANGTNRAPLHEAVRRGNEDVVGELLRHFENPWLIDKGDKDGRAALHEAAARGKEKLVRLLLQNSANTNIRDDYGMTPLHLLAWRGKCLPNEALTVVKALLEFDAEVNTKDQEGSTPLHDACKNGDYKMTHALLSYGADVGVKNGTGDTPRDVIAPDNHELYHLFEKPWAVSKRKIVANAPAEKPVLSENRKRACDGASAYVRYYWAGRDVSWATSVSVSQLIYGQSGLANIFDNFRDSIKDPDDQTLELPREEETWKWIHLPANNMTWVKDLIWLASTKRYEPKKAARTWSFWERTLNSRRSSSDANIRLPHAEDSWREDGRKSDKDTAVGRSANKARSKAKSNLGPVYGPKHPFRVTKASPYNRGITEAKSAEGTGYFPRQVWEKASFEERKQYRTFPSDRMLSLVFPFIDFESEAYLVLERYLNLTRLLQSPDWQKKVPQLSLRARREDALEQLRPWHMEKTILLFDCYGPYTGRDGLQQPKTLGASYYDMLAPEQIASRDRNQVVLRWFREEPFRKWWERRTELHPFATRREVYGDWKRYANLKHMAVELEAPSIMMTSQRAQTVPESVSASTGGQIDDLDIKQDTKDTTSGSTPKLLVVRQLWLWKLDNNTVITCCPDRCHVGAENTMFDTIRQSGIESMEGPDDLIERIVCECATFLNEYQSAGLGRHVLDIFDSMIGGNSYDEVQSFGKLIDDINGKDTLFPEDRKIAHEIHQLDEVKDIRDQLGLLRRVFEAQCGVLEDFSRLFWPGLKDKSRYCREGFLEDCGGKTLTDWTARLDEDAKRILGGLDRLVQVKQARISLDEAEASRRVNNYIVSFTIVTVIFTPLSFMASLFTVPLRQFPHDRNSELSYSSAWFAGRILAGELITLAAVALIIYFQRHPEKAWRVKFGVWMMYCSIRNQAFWQFSKLKRRLASWGSSNSSEV